MPEFDSLRFAILKEPYAVPAYKLDLIEIQGVNRGSTANLGSQLLNVFRFDVSAEPEDRVRTL